MITMNDKKNFLFILMVKFLKKNMPHFTEKKKIISILLNYLEILLLVGTLFK